MFGKSHTLFRPPGEADSLIIRVTDGCPWNGCKFCGMYKGVKYNFQGLEKVESIFSKHWKMWPDARRIFLADGVVDRTDTGCITKNSPCYGDVAEYLTGGRIRFGTQKIDPSLGDEFILYRFSTGQAVKVSLKPGVFPEAVAALEKKIRAGDFTDEEMRTCQRIEWDYARDLLSRPLTKSFNIQSLENFTWKPDDYEHLGKRGDVVNKERN